MPVMPGTPWRTSRSSRLPVARQLLWCGARSRTTTPGAERPAALVVVGVDAVVADVRVGEGDDLPGVRRIGDDLLVARQRGVEHQLAGGDAAASERRSPRPRTRCRRRGRAARLGSSRRPRRRARRRRPNSTVCLTLPRERSAGERRVARLDSPDAVGSTTHSWPGSNTVEVRGSARLDRADRARPIRRSPPAATTAAPGHPASGRMPGLDELGEGDRERGLEPEHARGRLLERSLLRLGGVRRVVGGDGVDGAVGQALADGVDVGLGAQRRVHLEHRVEAPRSTRR